MNALDFVFTPHNYIPSNFPLPFTVPATSTLVAAALSDVAKATTSMATALTNVETTSSGPEFQTVNAGPMGFVLYLVGRLQQMFATSQTNAIFFSGASRNYWVLTLFMVLLDRGGD
jgi:hypothetical protein